MRGLKGKRVLISGGSQGIGKATAQRFLEEGSAIFFCGHDPDEVSNTIQELKKLGTINAMSCDVSLEGDVIHLVKAAEHFLGGLDVLINNAGIA